MRWFLHATLVLFACFTATLAHAERRTALVIGNDAYAHLAVLKKAAANADAYGALFSAKGFDQVVVRKNLTRAEMDDAIARFIETVKPGDVAVFAYSGRGWSDGPQNYMIGIDGPAGGDRESLGRFSVPLLNGSNGVLDGMARQGAALKVAIIDAGRVVPPREDSGKARPAPAGKAAGSESPPGTFIVFASGAGKNPLDGLSDSDPDPNSVFTRVLVPLLQADQTLQKAVIETQRRVAELARTIGYAQHPAYYDETTGAVCLGKQC